MPQSDANTRTKAAMGFLEDHPQHFIVGVNSEGELDAYVALDPADKMIVIWEKKGTNIAKTASLGYDSERDLYSKLAKVAVSGATALEGLPGVNRES